MKAIPGRFEPVVCAVLAILWISPIPGCSSSETDPVREQVFLQPPEPPDPGTGLESFSGDSGAGTKADHKETWSVPREDRIVRSYPEEGGWRGWRPDFGMRWFAAFGDVLAFES